MKNIDSNHLECLERAAECRRKSDAAISQDARAKFRDAESRWLSLALSYEVDDH